MRFAESDVLFVNDVKFAVAFLFSVVFGYCAPVWSCPCVNDGYVGFVRVLDDVHKR